MINRTLFETLRIVEKNNEYTYDNENSYIESILAHLRQILNTRQGSVLIAENYGMPDLTNFPGDDLGEAVMKLEKIMRATIERYEPRLRKIKVSYNPDTSDSFTLKFSLSAEIHDGNNSYSHPIFFETVITSAGVVKVER